MSHRHAAVETLEVRRLFATLIPGETVITGIRSPGQQKNWSIDMVAGQAIVIAAGDLSGSAFQTEVILISPEGKTLRRAIGEEGSFLSRGAPVTGTYRVRVRDLGMNDTASVRVTAAFGAAPITDNDDAFAAQSGRRFAATIEQGDLDVWSVPVEKGQFTSIVATENTIGSDVDMGVLLLDPDGVAVQSAENAIGLNFSFNAAKTGTYSAIVYEPGANASGRYGISFGQAPSVPYEGDADTATPLTRGKTRNGDLPGGDTDVFTIPIGRGDKFSITLNRTSGTLNPEMLLVNDRGEVVSSVFGNTSATLNYTPTYSGNYYLIARDHQANSGGTFGIRYLINK
ncbi:MAG TPA: hypothetical protein VGB55_09945 [Tepidisphaeraceae bacterium]